MSFLSSRIKLKLYYTPGLISLVMLPLLINQYAWKYVRHYKQPVLEVHAENVVCNGEESLACAIGTDLIIYSGGGVPSLHSPNPEHLVFNRSKADSSTIIDEFFTLRYAGETLVVVGFCFIVLAGFGARRIYLYKR